MWNFDKIYRFEEITSTNDYAKFLGGTYQLKNALVVSQYQTKGRGKQGRSWEMDKGLNLMFSIMLRPSKTNLLPTFSMAAAIVESLNNINQGFLVKWPNDIIFDSKKIAGILTESSIRAGLVSFLVVGVGINCNQTEFSSDIAYKADSISNIIGKTVDREELLSEITEKFFTYYEDTEKTLQFIKKYSAVLNKNIVINFGQEFVKCKAIDITSSGSLLIEYNHTIREVISGEVSLEYI